ncbi:MAG: hypothetical protein GX863_05460 [Firmicutes bacterium]|jgi:hypothetical protein|nr:hypothetical protein [Candidatus Fermentithermobacillaceae bacterium]
MNPTREDIRNLLKGIHSVVVDAAMTGSMQNSRPYLADSAKGKVAIDNFSMVPSAAMPVRQRIRTSETRAVERRSLKVAPPLGDGAMGGSDRCC